MIQIHWRYDRTFHQPFHLQACFLILTRVPYVNDRMPDCKLEIFEDVRVQIHDINILGGLILAGFIVKTHCFSSSPVWCIACM
jgi:hypothetical protein